MNPQDQELYDTVRRRVEAGIPEWEREVFIEVVVPRVLDIVRELAIRCQALEQTLWEVGYQCRTKK